MEYKEHATYICLSYTWDNPFAEGRYYDEQYARVAQEYDHHARLYPILCNGSRLWVRKNLFDALQQLPLERFAAEVNPTKFHKHTVQLWIDALCINQQDTAEKSTQIMKMFSTFYHAYLTVAWLGPADSRTDLGCRTIAKLASAKGRLTGSNVIPYGENNRPEDYTAANLPVVTAEAWRCLGSIIFRQLFRRLWIVQEFIFCRRLFLLCGDREIDWDELVSLCKDIRERGRECGYPTSRVLGKPDSPGLDMEDALVGLAEWRQEIIEPKGAETMAEAKQPKEVEPTSKSKHEWKRSIFRRRKRLMRILELTWFYLASDPRDNIYAILDLNRLEETFRQKFPITPDRKTELDLSLRPDLKFKEALLPDYSLSVEECFAKTTKHIIEDSEDLTVLGLVQDRSLHSLPLPTWVPNYSSIFINVLDQSHGVGGSFEPSDLDHHNLSWDKLRVKGAAIARISQLADLPLVETERLIDPSWFDMTATTGNPYSNGQSNTEALWRTLCGDEDSAAGTHPAPKEYGEQFRLMICTMVCHEATKKASETTPSIHPSTYLLKAIQAAREIYQNRGFGLIERRLPTSNTSQASNAAEESNGISSEENPQDLTSTLLKLHHLHQQDSSSYTPSLDQINDFATKDWKGRFDLSFLDRFQISTTPYLHACRRINCIRRLYLTESGHLGIGLKSARVGDLVCIVRGMSTLAVLRKVAVSSSSSSSAAKENRRVSRCRNADNEYEFVGESYVHGLMHGGDSAGLNYRDRNKYEDIILV